MRDWGGKKSPEWGYVYLRERCWRFFFFGNLGLLDFVDERFFFLFGDTRYTKNLELLRQYRSSHSYFAAEKFLFRDSSIDIL